jgi:ATP-dependent 26S proteasome regulatory subunit
LCCVLLKLQDIQEDYIKEEQKSLKRELLRAQVHAHPGVACACLGSVQLCLSMLQEEVKRIQSVPLVIGQFLEMVDANSGIVGSTTGVQGGHCPYFLPVSYLSCILPLHYILLLYYIL